MGLQPEAPFLEEPKVDAGLSAEDQGHLTQHVELLERVI